MQNFTTISQNSSPNLWPHYQESLEHFDEKHIVGLFLQGSQNYGLAVPGSDVDTKLIITPTLRQIASASKPVSTTHIRENDEHIDFKDIRLYIETFRKQNLNFLEILFTDYYILNPLYQEQWNRLVAHREEIAHFNPWRAVKSMQGIAEEKFHALQHMYPSRAAIIEKYGYDPKQLHHLRRVENYLDRYIAGESYAECLNPKEFRQELIDIKLGKYSVDEAVRIANQSISHIRDTANKFYAVTPNIEDPEVNKLLNDVQYHIIKLSIEEELRK